MRVAIGIALIVWCLAAPAAPAAAWTGPDYAIVGSIPGSGGAWDYAVIDEQSDRLYLAQSGVTVLDLRTGRLTTRFVPGRATHGLAVLPEGLIAVDNAATKTITLFQGSTGKIVATIPTARRNPGQGLHALDSLLLEPKTGLLIAINGDSGLLLLVDYHAERVVGTVSLGHPAESAAADGTGHVYVNVNRPCGSEIDVLSMDSRRVERRIPLEGCLEATGLAIDRAGHLLISVCGNGRLELVRVDGRPMKAIPVGKGADAVILDRVHRRVFVPSAQGTLTIVSLRNADSIHVLQVLRTPKGTRLGAVDERTGRVYLPAASFGPPVPPIPYPSVIPGTFRILIVAPPRASTP